MSRGAFFKPQRKFLKNFLRFLRFFSLIGRIFMPNAEYSKINEVFAGLGKGGMSIMNVTDVRVRKINIDGKMKAIVSVTIDDSFVIHDVKVVEGQNGLFVAMPSRKTPEGEFRDIAHPITTNAREIIQSAVLQAYHEALA